MSFFGIGFRSLGDAGPCCVPTKIQAQFAGILSSETRLEDSHMNPLSRIGLAALMFAAGSLATLAGLAALGLAALRHAKRRTVR